MIQAARRRINAILPSWTVDTRGLSMHSDSVPEDTLGISIYDQ